MELTIALVVASAAALAATVLWRRARAEASAHRRAVSDLRAQLDASREEVRRAANAIAAHSQVVARGNRDLSELTEAQASAIAQAAANMERLASSVQHNTGSARATQDILTQARHAIREAVDAATNVIGRMETIRESTAKVSDIVGLIDGIAFQTNILALNAAVEASRAGEQGRGFAVVAAEVRSLSQRAASSAKEIKDLVTSAAAQVSASSEVVDHMAEAIAAINGRVAEVNELMNAVVAAGSEQSAGIGQVGRSIEEIERVTQQHAALVRQVVQAIESLSSQAARLAGPARALESK